MHVKIKLIKNLENFQNKNYIKITKKLINSKYLTHILKIINLQNKNN